MYFKKFFWPTKGKILLTLIILALLNVFLFPAVHNVYCEPCSPGEVCECPQPTSLVNISEVFVEGSFVHKTFVSVNYAFEILYVIVSYLAASAILFYKSGERK